MDSGEVGIEFHKWSASEQDYGGVEGTCKGWVFYNPLTTSVFTYPTFTQRKQYETIKVNAHHAHGRPGRLTVSAIELRVKHGATGHNERPAALLLPRMTTTMTQINFYKYGTEDYIKSWPNWSGEVPAMNDVVLLHYGDDYERERHYFVRFRCIDGTHPELVRIYVEEMKSPPLTDEEVEELREEMRKICEQNKQ